MKHNVKITTIILLMFLTSQFIGLYVVQSYSQEKITNGQIIKNSGKILPYGMGFQDEENVNETSMLFSIIFSFIIALSLIFLLIKIKAKFILKTWFFVVTILALGISFVAILPSVKYISLIALALAIPFAISKVYKKNLIVHNLTELFIYPGIAALFVPILGIISIIILLIFISIYDMWAVWKSGIMQKMAKFQMDKLNIFGGFFIPYASKKVKEKLRKLKKSGKDLRKSKIKINIAMLGGGDVIFPIITSGVFLRAWGLWSAMAIIFGAFLGLGGLLIFSEKKKFYPAMPFISAGIFLGILISWIFLI